MSPTSIDNALDTALVSEFWEPIPNEQKIRELISKGANINAVDSTGSSILMDAIYNTQEGLDIKFIELIISLGADLNYAGDDFNCLFDASLTQSPELVEILLKAGADPNCLSSDPPESLLDWAEIDQFVEESYERGGGELMQKVVQLLKDYGAKSISEIFADKPEKFLTVYAGYNPTGLYTLKGSLKPENIPSADLSFVNAFESWVASDPDRWGEYVYSEGKILNPPDISAVRNHNEHGQYLVDRIREMISSDIVLKYYFLQPDDLEKTGIRNVKHITL